MSAEGDTKTNIDSDMPEDTKISTKTTGGNNGSPKSTDGDVGKAFYEGLAGLIFFLLALRFRKQFHQKPFA